MKILVTGGAGFIGCNFIKLILNKYPDYKIVNFDKLTYAGNLENLTDVENNPNYSFFKGDICDANAVKKACADGVDAIINFAAESHVDRSIENPGSFIQTDVFGTYVLLEEARKNNCKFLQISTDEVYGSIEHGSFREEDALKPNSPYSASKAGGEMVVRSFHETFGLDTLITRSSNNFGSYQYPEKLIPLFITNLMTGKKVPLYGDGLNIRDWIYVEDNCKGIDAVFHKGKPGEIYNIGGGNEKTNIEITNIILEQLGQSETMIKHVADRLGHDRRYSLDCNKAKQKLGWKPKYSFEEAIKKTINWYQENTDWWNSVLNKSQ